MSDETYTAEEHAQFLEERKALIDAARESARTFDQAVLAFGSAIFGASIAFLKDVAPKPLPFTVKWIALAWGFFSIGLLFVVLSFLFSHRACFRQIELGEQVLKNRNIDLKDNPYSKATDRSNVLCVVFLFGGLLFWIVFAVENFLYRR